MNKNMIGAALVVLPAIVGGLVYANAQKQDSSESTSATASQGYICPATGEELPCPHCCPLKIGK